MARDTARRISARLDYVGHHAIFEGKQRNVEFIAPYSNVFLMRAELLDLTGGIRWSFRGHGSEDFEYFVRLSLYSNGMPPPRDVTLDECGPHSMGFFGPKRYRGFRAVSSIFALPGLLAGLKAFHLHHPKSEPTRGIDRTNDWTRNRFKQAVDKYWSRHTTCCVPISMDRSARVLCICVNPDHWGYFHFHCA